MEMSAFLGVIGFRLQLLCQGLVHFHIFSEFCWASRSLRAYSIQCPITEPSRLSSEPEPYGIPVFLGPPQSYLRLNLPQYLGFPLGHRVNRICARWHHPHLPLLFFWDFFSSLLPLGSLIFWPPPKPCLPFFFVVILTSTYRYVWSLILGYGLVKLIRKIKGHPNEKRSLASNNSIFRISRHPHGLF